MNFDEYVTHMSQKYRLAVAISVIKSRPNNLTIEEYLTQLQNKINMETDPNETVCSDDFNFDDDFITLNEENIQSLPNVVNENQYNCKSNKQHVDCFANENDSQGSQTILKDFVFDGDAGRHVSSIVKDSHIGDTLTLLKGVTKYKETKEQPFVYEQNLSQTTFCESQEEPQINSTENNTFCYSINNGANNLPEHIAKENNIDSQETELYSLHGFTQNYYSHVSQTQGENFVIDGKFIRSKVSDNITKEMTPNNATENVFNCMQYYQNDGSAQVTTNEYNFVQNDGRARETTNEYNFVQNDGRAQVTTNEYNFVQNDGRARETTNEYNFVQNDGRAQVTRNEYNFVQNYKKAHIEEDRNEKQIEKCIQVTNYEEICNDKDQTQMAVENNTIFENVQALKEINDNFNDEMDTDGDSDHDSQTEIVPFKVLGELNKVRAFLNKRDGRSTGYSTDSGYRSDSQMRSSFKSSQLSGVWLNQSAHCLFSFIVQAPTGSEDIINEISQVLGHLIDKLHDEDNYPSFLEELLETVDNLIRDTHERGSWAENVLITKDEDLHRLILLSKSKHVLKHCIEKITNILENLHANLTNENLYELTNITETENICYIFHILEIFLRRYMKVRNVSSQASTQNSQDEERFPKRSSLTDLWRKKWNPNFKETSIVQENVTVCVLKRCSEVLNKIIVECMDGYSLVAFAALQCFNLIQS